MSSLGWLVVVMVLIVLAIAAFVVIRIRRRTGGVIAIRKTKR